MTITINIVEWVACLIVIVMALYAADKTLELYIKWLEWRIKRMKERKK